jgi:RAD51-like protein 2
MTTRIAKDSANSTLVPALGETWAHSANIRLLLSWKNNMRYANLTKSSYLPDATVFYKITVSW